MSNHVRLLTNSAITINRIVALLEEQGIPSVIRNNVESARLAGFGSAQNDVDLLVEESDFMQAKEIVEEFYKDLK